jgi:outer membrane protein TolC
MRCLLVACLLIPRLASAETKLTLDQVLAKAIASPRVAMARGDIDAAAARAEEADAARYPRGKATAIGTISPEIRCVDPACTMTSPHNFAWRFSGLFGSAQLDITQPLFTFGKIAHARAAARAGVDAQQALADEAAGDAVSDAARAYWGIKLARELGYMLDDGIEEIEKAKSHFDEQPDITVQDRQRVAVLLAEAKTQRADAAQAEAQAIAGLRAITGVPDADVDDADLAPVAHDLPASLGNLADKRPQRVAARSGASAADELAAFETAHFYPDLAIVASGVIARAQGADDPPSAFANDPYNRSGIGVVLGLQWTLEPWTVKARADRARAEARKLHAQSDLAAVGARYDLETANSEAVAARAKIAAADEGEKAARTWLAAVLQNQAIGTAEAKDLADAYIAWFQMKARWATAVFQWNVAVVRMGRAGGEFHATPGRPR